MALTERSRSAIYQGLSGLIRDEEAVGEMLSYFPARDVEEPATKDFVRAEVAGLRAEVHDAATRIIIWTVAANTTTTVGLILALTRLD